MNITIAHNNALQLVANIWFTGRRSRPRLRGQRAGGLWPPTGARSGAVRAVRVAVRLQTALEKLRCSVCAFPVTL